MASRYKLMVLGPSGVGKTSVLVQLTHHRFLDGCMDYVDDTFRKRIVIDDEPTVFDVFDGTDDDTVPNPMREEYLRTSQGFMLVFDVSYRRSFEQITSFVSSIKEKNVGDSEAQRTTLPPLVLVGNKCDVSYEERQVSEQEAQETAVSMGCPYIETSAKNRTNIEESFFALIRLIRKQNHDNPPQRRPRRNRCAVM